MTVPVVVVHGRQLIQFRLVPNEHVLCAGRPIVGATGGRRRRRRRAGASATAAAAVASTAVAARAADQRTTERRLLILLVDGHVHAGHEADTGLLLLGLYPAAAASIPSEAGHQGGPPPDDGQTLLPLNPLQRIGQPAIVVHRVLSAGVQHWPTLPKVRPVTS